MDLIQKIKEQGNQASVMLPGVTGMAASSEVITVDITGCTNYDEDEMFFEIREDRPIQNTQILDWIKGKAKFLRLTFKYGGKYHSALFIKDAISNADSLEYYTEGFNVISSIMRMGDNKNIVFDLRIQPSENKVSFKVLSLTYSVPM